ncbi:putative F-box/FBD/LRR-repeat protein [Capsicum baccatum]|uniref:F-box/FBD/LRR-repeat protein n=1 Tax=Capsicum baccatum TaxID=33114 RepID=A0A2G2VJP4_CAPBA|nr:putative F-box/FBD/LRR-repeat protein [Capsicum baccatum]
MRLRRRRRKHSPKVIPPPSVGAEVQRRRRGRKTLDDDRISQLPDSLLIQILSLLPTVEASRTSILSKSFAVERNVEHVVLRSYDEPILFNPLSTEDLILEEV